MDPRPAVKLTLVEHALPSLPVANRSTHPVRRVSDYPTGQWFATIVRESGPDDQLSNRLWDDEETVHSVVAAKINIGTSSRVLRGPGRENDDALAGRHECVGLPVDC